MYLADQGHYEQALAHLREHLLACPSDGWALHQAGALLHKLGRYEEAENHLRRALDCLPASVRVGRVGKADQAR